jgi:ribosome-associated GTPase EngA
MAEFEHSFDKPTLAIIGRPNVGKSTLVNRIIGRREAVVEDRPGVTRDRVIYDATWAGIDFNVMDTGGWDNKVEGLDKLVTEAAEFGAFSADALLFIVDVRTGITNTDEALLRAIRKAKRPTLLVVNKVDSEALAAQAMEFWNLGLGEPFPISALHGRGSGDLLDRVMNMFEEAGYDLDAERSVSAAELEEQFDFGDAIPWDPSKLDEIDAQAFLNVADEYDGDLDSLDELDDFDDLDELDDLDGIDDFSGLDDEFLDITEEEFEQRQKAIGGDLTPLAPLKPQRKGDARKIAIVGRPNVGKSSLLNQLAGKERAVVSSIAGTTRDPLDETVELEGQLFKLIDTAGIRRKVHLIDGADYYASLRTSAAIHRSELAVVVIDVSGNIAEQDLKVINTVVDAGRAIVLVFNKWDQLAEKFDVDGRRELLEREIEQDLNFVTWAPRVNLSAKTGWHTNRLVAAMNTSLESWQKRIPTSEFNAFLGRLTSEHPHPIRGGKQPRILFGAQVSTMPPRFVLHTNGFLEHQYRRFIERRIREEYGFEGTPIDISMRVKEKNRR